MDDEQAYLEPGFDPSSLTIPRIRSILVAHNVAYPSSAKKSQLIDIFNDQILPQARRLRAANARVKRTSRGIEDMPSSQNSVSGEELEEELEEVPAVRTPARRTGSRTNPRRSTRAQTEDVEDDSRTPLAAPRHSTAPPERTPRRVPSRKIPGSGHDSEQKIIHATSDFSKRTVATPRMKKEPVDDDNDSPFSSENFFQSATSPSTTFDSDRRRTAGGSILASTDKRMSRDSRLSLDDVRAARSRLSEQPLSPVKSIREAAFAQPDPALEPSEEFAPEEQQELAEAQQSGQLVRANPKQRSGVARSGPAAIVVALLSGIAAVWRQEKLEVGYCGVGRPTTELGGVQIPDWADILRPQCEPCPPHAFCGDKLETVCDTDFVLTPHPLSFNGIVPLVPTCEPDSAKARKVDAVRERAIEELREQNARYECGQAASAEVKEPALKQAISTKRRKGMTNEEFEDLWASALGEIQRADEVVTGADGSSGVFTLRSTSLVRLPFGCAVRRSLRETLRHYFWQLIIVLTVISSSSYAHFYLTTGAETERRAKDLARLALDKLANQAALHAYDAETYRENYMSVAQLRDDVLRDEFSAARRQKLWEKVQKKVEGNSNVRPMVREGRSGDVGRVWEWVGAVGLIEDTPGKSDGGVSRRKSGRVSWGGVSDERAVVPSRTGDAPGSMGKWTEQERYY